MEINYAEIARPYLDRAATFHVKPTAIQMHEAQLGQAYALLAIARELKYANDERGGKLRCSACGVRLPRQGRCQRPLGKCPVRDA